MSVTVNFRGVDREITVDAVYDEPDVGYFGIDWHFDGLSLDDHIALKITDEEERRIEESLYDAIQNDLVSSYEEY